MEATKAQQLSDWLGVKVHENQVRHLKILIRLTVVDQLSFNLSSDSCRPSLQLILRWVERSSSILTALQVYLQALCVEDASIPSIKIVASSACLLQSRLSSLTPLSKSLQSGCTAIRSWWLEGMTLGK